MDDSSTMRLVADLRSWVDAAAPGARLPSSRDLVSRYGVSPVTVQKAVRRISALGLVEPRPGVGTFVRASRPARTVDHGWQTAALGSRGPAPTVSATHRAIPPDAIALHSGYPSPALLPERLVRQAIGRAARTDAAVTRAPVAGLPDLQAWFAGEIAAGSAGGLSRPSAREVLITPGTQAGLGSVLRSVVGPGRPLLAESPTYWGAILAARAAGITLVPVPVGAAGPDPEDVERAFAQSGARAFYAQPTSANPTGGSWPQETREAVLATARRHGAFVIEDDWAHDLAIDRDPHPLIADDGDGRVIYLRSLTKSLSPALRVGAVVARGPVRERILADLAAEAMYVSHLLQSAALDVVTRPAWRTHQRGLRQDIRSRRDHLLEGLTRHAPEVSVETRPLGGVSLWVRLPDGSDLDAVVRACAARGLFIAPGSEWFPAEPTGPYVRLNYAVANPERFEEAATILQASLEGE